MRLTLSLVTLFLGVILGLVAISSWQPLWVRQFILVVSVALVFLSYIVYVFFLVMRTYRKSYPVCAELLEFSLLVVFRQQRGGITSVGFRNDIDRSWCRRFG